jgi:hypothetical protein
LIGAALQAGLVINTAAGPPELVRLGFDTYNAAITIAGGGYAVAAAAAGVSALRTGALPRWLGQAGIVIGALHLVTLPGLVIESDPWAAGGPVALVVFVVLVAWYTAVTAHLVRRRTWLC